MLARCATLLVLCDLAIGVAAHAACNLIPQAQPAFRGVLGTFDRPFAAPGDYVDVRVRESACDAGSPGIAGTADAHEVTLLFEPPGDERRAVVLTTAPCATLTTRLDVCGAAAGMAAGGVSCVQVNQGGDPFGMAVVVVGGENHLRFRFPETDALIPPDGDRRGFAGPVTIAVSPAGAALPCGLATNTCAAQAGALGLIACVDDLYAADGTCQPNRGETFAQFTALPPANDFRAACYDASPPCTATATEIRFAIDGEGNLLFPVHWDGVLPTTSVRPVPRLLRGTVRPVVPITIPDRAFLSSFTPEGQSLPPIFEPQTDATAAVDGAVTFFGTADAPATVLRIAHRRGRCAGGPEPGTACNVDSRCGLGGTCVDACVGGANDGLVCASKNDCPQGVCGALYDADAFRDLLASGGPLIVPRVAAPDPGICQAPPFDVCAANADCMSEPCVSYAFQAEDPVALESLTAGSENVLALTAPETLAIVDQTGDGDLTDVALRVRDRITGKPQPLGAPDGFTSTGSPLPGCGLGPADGRSIVRVRFDAYQAAAISTEGDVVAFIESENGEGFCDENGDGDRNDGILRVFTVPGDERTAGVTPPRAVDPALIVNGQSLVVSDGKVFFRTSERETARGTTERLSIATGLAGAEANGASRLCDLSRDGRWVAVASAASNLLGPGLDTNADWDAFVRDRTTGVVTRVSVTSAGAEVANEEIGNVSVSADGRYVAFDSRANTLVPGDTNVCSGPVNCSDVFVRDRDSDENGVFDEVGGTTTTRVSVGPGGVEGDGHSRKPVISANGATVVFQSDATNLVAGDTNGELDVFAWDRGSGVVERIDVADNGAQNEGAQLEERDYDVSDDGRYVVFDVRTTNLPAGPSNSHVGGQMDCFMRFRDQGITFQFINPFIGFATELASHPRISGDGRYIVFQNQPDFSGQTDVWLRDTFVSFPEQLNVPVSTGTGPPYSALAPTISDDGRFVTFWANGSQLLPPGADGNGRYDLYVRDRLLSSLERLNLTTSGGEGAGETAPGAAMVSADGREALFDSADATLLGPGGDGNGASDVFVRRADDSDPGGIDTLLFGDGRLDDTVLEVLDAAAGSITTLCPADRVAVVDGMAAFLRPESAVGTAACPGGSLNGDMDVDDRVVQLWTGTGSVQNLGKAATDVEIVPGYVAALVSEAHEGVDLNGDFDMGDDVVAVHPVGGGAWTNVGQQADVLYACGSVFAFITREGGQGITDLNGDGDPLDEVAQIYVPATGTLINTGQQADDMVCSDQTVAFRSGEAKQGMDLIVGSGPAPFPNWHFVVQGYDIGRPECLTPGHPADCLRNSHQVARICDFEACDPRFPYRVQGTKVKFLTNECDQRGSDPLGTCTYPGTDLTGDGNVGDMVLQVFDVREGAARPVTGGRLGADNPLQAGDASAGGSVVVGSGRCLESLGTACSEMAPCGESEICVEGTCQHEHRTCVTSDDCPPGVTCRTDGNVPGIVTASPDGDEDGIPDHIDNCPADANVSQVDTDGDGSGDVCDRATCGDGLITYDEVCESGNDAACPGACANCQCTVCGNLVADPKKKAQVSTKNEAGQLTAGFLIPLGSYTDAPVSVTLSDGDSPVIARGNLGALPPSGKPPFKKWVYKSKLKTGIAQVQLQSRGPKQPGIFKLSVKAKKWFASAAANQPAAATDLTVTIGTQCFRVPVTKKTP